MQVEQQCCENFISNNDDKNEIILPVELQISIDSIIRKEGYITYNVEKKINSPDGGNYLAALYEIDIKGKTKNGDKETNIFVKHIIPFEELKKFLNLTDAYSNEVIIYKELSKIFKTLQDKANIPEEERYRMVKCYDETNPECIMMENMAKKGYATPYRMNVVSLKFAELSVQQLAKFHGLSFAMREKMPEYFEKKIMTLKQPVEYNDHWKPTALNMAKITAKNIKPEFRKKLEPFMLTFIEKYVEYLTESSEVVNCMCHGDFRPNNILKREKNGEVVDVITVDYQILNYGCPVNDFIYFIFSCTDRKFRIEHLENLKNLYYNTFKEYLAYFNIAADEVFSKKQFEQTFNDRFDFSLMTALFFYPLFFAPESDLHDVGKEAMKDFVYDLSTDISVRVEEIISECIELGFL